MVDVLDILRRTDALLEGHFELSSGLHSDRYFQCALCLQHPEQAEKLAGALAAGVRELLGGEGPDVVVGPALGAVVWQHEVARALGTRGLFTERAGKKGDGMALRRGFRLAPSERVLVVEDVLTTGGSAKEVITLLRELGAEPVAVGAIVNRSGGNPFTQEGLPLVALAEVEAQTFEPASCPLCAAGGTAIKPGSRPATSGGPVA